MRTVGDLGPGDIINQDGVKFIIKRIVTSDDGMAAIEFEDMPCSPEGMEAYGKLLKLSVQELRKKRGGTGD